MQKHALVQIQQVSKNYYDGKTIIPALKDVSFDIYHHEIISLLGVNGAGKTTLSSIIATLHPATSGDILFEDSSIYQNVNFFRKFIGYCPQKPNLHPYLTVEQNLIFAGRYYGLSDVVIKERMAKLVQQFELQEYLDRLPSVLSGGYQQRCLIVRALLHNPKLIILDEPTVGLDPHIRHQLWEYIKQLPQQGVSVLLTTHYLDEADILSDRVCILDKGVIRLIDTPEKLKQDFKQERLEDVFLQLMSVID